MPSVRPLRAVLLAAAALAPALLPGAVAGADGPATTTVVGRLVQTWAEAAPGAHEHGDDAPLSWVEPQHGDAVRVPAGDLAGVSAGSTVAVTLGGEAADDDAEGVQPAREVLDAEVVAPARVAPLSPARGLTNQVTVALVAPQGATPDAVTPAQVAAVVDGPVADFWAEQSGGAIAVGVTAAHDWVHTRAGCADPTALWNEAARAVGFRSGPGKHLLLYLGGTADQLAGCAYALAEVGAGPSSGGRLYVRDTLPTVIAHELGHTFGLGHSSGVQCDRAVETGRCRTEAYGDLYDVMGASWERTGALNAAQAARIGLLPATAQRRVTLGDAGGTVVLQPLAGRAGTRAVRLVDGAVTYWLEYRAPAGRDAWLGTADNRFGLDAGVLLHRSGALPDTSLLLDGTPSAAAGWDGDRRAALPVGVPVPVADGDFTVTVRSLTADAATIDVAVAPGAEPAAAPPADASAQAVLPGTPCTTDCSGAATAPGAGTAVQPSPDSQPAGTEGAAPAPVARKAPSAAAAEPAGTAGAPAAAGARPSLLTTAADHPVTVPLVGALVGGSVLLLVRRRRRESLAAPHAER